LAAEPKYAARVLVEGMRRGTFTGRKLSDYVNASGTDYRRARRVVNGNDRDVEIAKMAQRFERSLVPASGSSGGFGSLVSAVTAAAQAAASSGGSSSSRTKVSTRQAQAILARAGWPTAVDGDAGPQTRRHVKQFQEAWTFTNLDNDGVVGPATSAALLHCDRINGRISPHFQAKEFASRGNGEIAIHRSVVRAAEAIRAEMGGKPMVIISGFRDHTHNRRVGGVSNSQHVEGRAIDLSVRYGLTVDRLLKLRVASGIGYQIVGGRRLVRHFDTRTNRSVSNPAMWRY